MALQPALAAGTNPETRFDQSTVATAAQQSRGSGRLHAAQHGIQCIKKDGFARAGFTGQHGKTLIKRQIQAVDQCDVLESQTGEHGKPRWSC